jgi:hypothetical protein
VIALSEYCFGEREGQQERQGAQESLHFVSLSK